MKLFLVRIAAPLTPAADALLIEAGFDQTVRADGGSRVRLPSGEYAYEGGDHITARDVAAGARAVLEPEAEPPGVVVLEVARVWAAAG